MLLVTRNRALLRQVPTAERRTKRLNQVKSAPDTSAKLVCQSLTMDNWCLSKRVLLLHVYARGLQWVTAPQDSIPISQIKIKDKTSKSTAKTLTSCSLPKPPIPQSHPSPLSSSAKHLGLSLRRCHSWLSYPQPWANPRTEAQNRKIRVKKIKFTRFKIKLTKFRTTISHKLTHSIV